MQHKSKFWYPSKEKLWNDWCRACSPWTKSLKNLPCTVSFLSFLCHWYSYQATSKGKKKHDLSSLPFFLQQNQMWFFSELKKVWITLHFATDFKADKALNWIYHWLLNCDTRPQADQGSNTLLYSGLAQTLWCNSLINPEKMNLLFMVINFT